ncbi:MAG: lipid-A-disaccharide synthase [bacterium TMED217]|nr:MAG: lipid-A-disaccharide synthase [bacterium TMED217]
MNKKLLKMIKKKIVLIAGEDSGDLHGSHLMREIKSSDSSFEFHGIGGDQMIREGLKPIEHIKNLNVIGIVEVLKHYPRIKKIFNATLAFIKKTMPEKVVLIDYPGFNLRLAKKISKMGVEVSYFILPQVWAWKSSRAKTLEKNTDKRISIIPIEKNWFKARGIDIKYVGNPLINLKNISGKRDDLCQKHGISYDKKIVVLMPGSRKSEIEKHWKIFLETIDILDKKLNKKIIPVVLEAPNVSINNVPDNFIVTKEQHYEMLSIADAAIVSSGTATLETAMLGCPMVVCYRLSPITWFLAQKMSSVKYLSLVNLISNKKIVKELLQSKMVASNIAEEVLFLLSDDGQKNVKSGYRELVNCLTSKTDPYQEAAQYILE